MDIVMKFVGWWDLQELSGIIEEEIGFVPEATAIEGKLTIFPRPRALSESDEDWLRTYLEEHPQQSFAEWSAKYTVVEQEEQRMRREKLEKLKNPMMTMLELQDAVRVLAELAGVDLGSN